MTEKWGRNQMKPVSPLRIWSRRVLWNKKKTESFTEAMKWDCKKC